MPAPPSLPLTDADKALLQKALSYIKKGKRIPKTVFAKLTSPTSTLPKRIKTKLQKFQDHFTKLKVGGVQAICIVMNANENGKQCDIDHNGKTLLGEGACGKVYQMSDDTILKVSEDLPTEVKTFLCKTLPITLTLYNTSYKLPIYKYLQCNEKQLTYAMSKMDPINVRRMPLDIPAFFGNLLKCMLNLVTNFHSNCSMIHFDCKVDNAMFYKKEGTKLIEHLQKNAYVIDIDGAILISALNNTTIYNHDFHPYTPMFAHPHIILKYNENLLFDATLDGQPSWARHDAIRNVVTYSNARAETVLRHQDYHGIIFGNAYTLENFYKGADDTSKLKFCDLYSMAMSVLYMAHLAPLGQAVFQDLETITCTVLKAKARALELPVQSGQSGGTFAFTFTNKITPSTISSGPSAIPVRYTITGPARSYPSSITAHAQHSSQGYISPAPVHSLMTNYMTSQPTQRGPQSYDSPGIEGQSSHPRILYNVIGFGRVTYIIDSSEVEPEYTDEEMNQFVTAKVELVNL